MRLFLDCEFNEFKGALISMALVDENGREWYEVVPCEKPGPWVAEHVMPILGRGPVSIPLMQASLSAWLALYDSVHIVADWPEDIAHFCQALITGPGMRLNTPPLTMEVVRIDAESELPHNALADARGIRAALAAREPAEKSVPALSVVYGPMPETNGKSNFTAILCRDGDVLDGFTIARSEYPDRVRYEADCVRFLIGEIQARPNLNDYDGDKHSGYVNPAAQAVPVPEGMARKDCGTCAHGQQEPYSDPCKYCSGYRREDGIVFSRWVLAAAKESGR